MFPRRQPVVDDQGEHDIAGRRFPIGNVFAPAAAEIPVARDPLSGVTAIFSFVAEPAIRLICAMIGGRLTHPAGEGERRQGLSALEKANRLIERGTAFFGSDSRMAWTNEDISAHSSALF